MQCRWTVDHLRQLVLQRSRIARCPAGSVRERVTGHVAFARCSSSPPPRRLRCPASPQPRRSCSKTPPPVAPRWWAPRCRVPPGVPAPSGPMAVYGTLTPAEDLDAFAFVPARTSETTITLLLQDPLLADAFSPTLSVAEEDTDSIKARRPSQRPPGSFGAYDLERPADSEPPPDEYRISGTERPPPRITFGREGPPCDPLDGRTARRWPSSPGTT